METDPAIRSRVPGDMLKSAVVAGVEHASVRQYCHAVRMPGDAVQTNRHGIGNRSHHPQASAR
jgi:hypothetical protein